MWSPPSSRRTSSDVSRPREHSFIQANNSQAVRTALRARSIATHLIGQWEKVVTIGENTGDLALKKKSSLAVVAMIEPKIVDDTIRQRTLWVPQRRTSYRFLSQIKVQDERELFSTSLMTTSEPKP